MLRQFWIVLLSVLSIATSALAAPPIIRVTTEAPQGAAAASGDPTKQEPARVALDVAVTEATSDEELESTVRWVEKDLAQAQNLNPDLKPQLVVAAPDADGQPEAREADVTVNGSGKGSLRALVRDMLYRHYRVSFSVIRGVANSTVVTWGLIFSSHLTLSQSLPVALVAGSMSGGLQFFNQKYQEWQLQSKTTVGRMGRNMVTQSIYLAITKFVSLMSGVPTEHSLVAATGSILKASVMGTLAQGTWGLAIAENARIQTEMHPEKAEAIRRGNDFKTLALSMVSTALSVANMLGAPLTDAGMMVMTATGAVYYGWVALKAKKWAKTQAEQQSLACEANLVKP